MNIVLVIKILLIVLGILLIINHIHKRNLKKTLNNLYEIISQTEKLINQQQTDIRELENNIFYTENFYKDLKTKWDDNKKDVIQTRKYILDIDNISKILYAKTLELNKEINKQGFLIKEIKDNTKEIQENIPSYIDINTYENNLEILKTINKKLKEKEKENTSKLLEETLQLKELYKENQDIEQEKAFWTKRKELSDKILHQWTETIKCLKRKEDELQANNSKINEEVNSYNIFLNYKNNFENLYFPLKNKMHWFKRRYINNLSIIEKWNTLENKSEDVTKILHIIIKKNKELQEKLTLKNNEIKEIIENNKFPNLNSFEEYVSKLVELINIKESLHQERKLCLEKLSKIQLDIDDKYRECNVKKREAFAIQFDFLYTILCEVKGIVDKTQSKKQKLKKYKNNYKELEKDWRDAEEEFSNIKNNTFKLIEILSDLDNKSEKLELEKEKEEIFIQEEETKIENLEKNLDYVDMKSYQQDLKILNEINTKLKDERTKNIKSLFSEILQLKKGYETTQENKNLWDNLIEEANKTLQSWNIKVKNKKINIGLQDNENDIRKAIEIWETFLNQKIDYESQYYKTENKMYLFSLQDEEYFKWKDLKYKWSIYENIGKTEINDLHIIQQENIETQKQVLSKYKEIETVILKIKFPNLSSFEKYLSTLMLLIELKEKLEKKRKLWLEKLNKINEMSDIKRKKCNLKKEMEIKNFNKFVSLNEVYLSWKDAEKVHELYNQIKSIKQHSYSNSLDFSKFDICNNFEQWRIKHNGTYIEENLKKYKDYFDQMFKYPLDEQQRVAVLRDEDYTQIIAGAGSGKTTTIQAKVKFLVEKMGISPNKILLLAFNKSAKEEMQTRICEDMSINVDVHIFTVLDYL